MVEQLQLIVETAAADQGYSCSWSGKQLQLIMVNIAAHQMNKEFGQETAAAYQGGSCG